MAEHFPAKRGFIPDKWQPFESVDDVRALARQFAKVVA